VAAAPAAARAGVDSKWISAPSADALAVRKRNVFTADGIVMSIPPWRRARRAFRDRHPPIAISMPRAGTGDPAVLRADFASRGARVRRRSDDL
jgi:hypothetical protein